MRPFANRLIVMALLTLSLAACAKKTALTTDDMSLGNPQAKVTMIEYASVGCPVCAKFNNEVFPALKAKYIDTGKIHYVMREVLVGGGEEVSLGASGFLLARCAGKDKYFAVTDAVFHAQSDIYDGHEDPHAALLKIAQSTGMNEDQFNACINDDAAILALNQRSQDHFKNDNVDATPTFVINGVALTPGYHPLTELDTAIAAAQAAAK
jgi:protein-disulfide isomerase